MSVDVRQALPNAWSGELKPACAPGLAGFAAAGSALAAGTDICTPTADRTAAAATQRRHFFFNARTIPP
jgi:hypothetical protein